MALVIATYGSSTGRCNICGELGKLTDDHTPPKGCIRIGQVAIQHIVDRLGVEKPNYKGYRSQNGVKYKTLCSRCNSARLGANFDVALASFTNATGSCLQSPIALPATISIRAKPQKIMRAILGHLAAQGVNRYEKGENTEPLRDYFLNDTLPLPDFINIYYWVFPYKGQVLVRDCMFTDLRVGEPVHIWLMKFFPVAFLVTWDEPADYKFGLQNLARWRTCSIDEEVDISVSLVNLVKQHWPEAPTNHTFLTYGAEAVYADMVPSRI